MPETAAPSGEAVAALFKESRQPMWALDARTLRFIDVNKAALRFYGYSREEFLRLRLFDLRPGAGRRLVEKNLRAFPRAGVPWIGESRHRKKSGALVDVRVFSVPARLRGRAVWLAAVMTGPVDAKAQSVVTHPELFDTRSLPVLFQRNPEPMWVFDVATLRFLAVNEAAVRLYGYSRKDFRRMKLSDIRPPEDRGKVARLVRKEARRNAYHIGVWRHLKRDGTVMYVDVRALDIVFAGRQARLAMLTDVTERRLLEERRAEAEQRLESVAGHAPIVLFALDRRGVFTVSEGQGLAGLGLRPGQVVGRSIFEVYRGHARILADARRALKGEAFVGVSDAGGRSFETRWTPLRGASGPAGAIGVAIDVTEQHRLDNELRASEERYRELYRRTPAIMHSIDRAGRIVGVSDRWLEVMGYRREDVLGRRSVEFLTQASRDFARKKVLPEFYRTGVTRDAPYQMVKSSGEIMDVLLSATSERDARGRVIRSFAVINDITPRKRAQEALARATAWFEAMFESSPDGIVSTDAAGRFLRVNKAFERLVGYSQKELLRRTFQDITPPEFHDVGARAIRRMAAGGDAATHVKEYLRKDGTRVPVHITGFAVKDKAGRIEGFAAIIANMTEARRLEKEIAETTAREQAKIGRDLHDSVGQTLTALSLGLKALQRLLPPKGRGRREAARLESLASLSVQQVRDVARGLLPHELQAGDLGASLRTLAHGAREMFGVPCQVAVRGDTRLSDNSAAVQLYRIAQEALNNAAKHARPRTGVRLSVDAGSKVLRLAVRDDGVGLPARLGRERRGLGIEIMKHRAASLGGTLAVRRAPGGGTEVVCECPRPGSPR